MRGRGRGRDERGDFHRLAEGYESRVVNFDGGGRGRIDDCDAHCAGGDELVVVKEGEGSVGRRVEGS